MRTGKAVVAELAWLGRGATRSPRAEHTPKSFLPFEAAGRCVRKEVELQWAPAGRPTCIFPPCGWEGVWPGCAYVGRENALGVAGVGAMGLRRCRARSRWLGPHPQVEVWVE
jgi:hypothetical protein